MLPPIVPPAPPVPPPDRKSTRLNSSYITSSYAVFCLKKKKAYDHQPDSLGVSRCSAQAPADHSAIIAHPQPIRRAPTSGYNACYASSQEHSTDLNVPV